MEILMWNHAMAELTHTPSEEVTGSYLEDIAEPWRGLLTEFSNNREMHDYRREIVLHGRPHWISLHKAIIEGPITEGVYDQVMMLEDVTETQLLEQELMHSERLASVGRLAAGVAHEIGNPITGIACLAQNLRYDSDNPEVLETAEQILSQTARVTRIVQSLVGFSHTGHTTKSQFQPVVLHNCATEAISLLSLQKDKQQVQFINDIAKNAIVAGDTQRMIQVFINLLSNARDASPEHGRVILESSEDEYSIDIQVTDEGSGIPAEIQDRILEPFFTTKEPGEGTGLGLAMVYSIVEDHGGMLDIVSPIDTVRQRGAQFIVKLPRHLDTLVEP
jgi:signal transduction histidine kinase